MNRARLTTLLLVVCVASAHGTRQQHDDGPLHKRDAELVPGASCSSEQQQQQQQQQLYEEQQQQQQVSRLLPWLNRDTATPLPWEGLHNDLPALLKVQARNNSVAVLVFSDGFAALALNCITSLVVYGKAESYVVATVGAASLQQCQKLRLPCYDATSLTGGAEDRESGRYSKDWFHHVWAKTLVVHEVFKHGVDVLFADADTVFIKDVHAYNQLLDDFDADGSFMYEEANKTAPGANHTHLIRYMNSGNFYMRNNERTRALMDKWKEGYYEHGDNNGNQLWLNRMANWPAGSPVSAPAPFAVCHTREQCQSVRARGIAAIKPHPNQFEGVGQMCLPDHLFAQEPLCSERRIYIHAVCRSGSGIKQRAFEALGLWFIHVYSMPDAVDVRLPVQGAVLPCRGAGALTWGLSPLEQEIR